VRAQLKKREHDERAKSESPGVYFLKSGSAPIEKRDSEEAAKTRREREETTGHNG